MTAQINHIHRAIGGEMLKVEEQASHLDVSSPESLQALVGHLGMVRNILDIHANEEDRNIFPMVDAAIPGITAAYSLDHEHEHELFAVIDADIAALQSNTAADRAATGKRLYRNIVAVTSHLINHMAKEEAHPYARYVDLLTEEQELDMVGHVLNAIPEQALAMSMPWQASFLTNEEVLGNLELYMRILGPEKQRAFISPLARGLPAERWQSLTEANPALTAFA